MTPGEPQYVGLTDEQLVRRLIGVRQTRKAYRGSLQSLFSPASFGESPPERCLVARELVKRWLAEELRERPVLTSPSAVRDFLRVQLAHREYEVFLVLHLDAQHRLIAAEELFRGTLMQTSVYPREVVRAALQRNAAAVMFCHNHPSGVAQPSRADELLTRNLKEALGLVEVRVLDHFIVAGNHCLSFAERGLL